MHVTLFDDSARDSLLPLTFTRPVAEIRIGILKISEKWEKYLNADISYHTADYLSSKYPGPFSDKTTFINGSICPDNDLVEAIKSLAEGVALMYGDILIALKLNDYTFSDFNTRALGFDSIQYAGEIFRISYPEEIFVNNGAELRKDFTLLTAGRTSAPLSTTNTVLGTDVFVEEGASVECSIINSLQGPVYIGRHAEIWEGCMVRGPFALCDHSTLKMGTKVYPKCTIGPYSRIGGEINNIVVMGNSSKGHDGYLGNSVLGEWCNLGADTNNSNLKNNYAEVKLWDYHSGGMRGTGLQFCGLIMGDHSKAGINTMFNTGTVVGVGANVFGGGYPPNFIPDFSWGGRECMEVHKVDKMLDTAKKVFERRASDLNHIDEAIINTIFEETRQYRNF